MFRSPTYWIFLFVTTMQAVRRISAFGVSLARTTRRCRPSTSPSPSAVMQRTRMVTATERLCWSGSCSFPSPSLPRRLSSTSSRLYSASTDARNDDGIFADSSTTFQSLGIKSSTLIDRLNQLGLTRPTQVQAESYEKIREGGGNVVIGAETGSGKTLAYLLPLLDDILLKKESDNGVEYDYARAIILVPNKELVQQVLRMAVPLCGGKQSVVWGGRDLELPEDDADVKTKPQNTVRIAVMPGGLNDPLDFKPFRDSMALGGDDPPVDLVISTPAAVGPLGLKPKNIDMFADIPTLVVDEADMLLDGGYIRPLENVLMGFRRADRLDPSMEVPKTQHVFCAATLPDMGLKSVDAYLQRKFPHAERIHMDGMHNARHYGLAEATMWYQVESKKQRMEKLIELLETPKDSGGLLGEKVMVFLNSVDDVEGAHGALEQAGVDSVPYHAKIKLNDRASNLDSFRRYKNGESSDGGRVPVLVCTDLASRGLDIPDVNAVVQLQFSGNVVSHLHRMGRCGRAGQKTGRGIVFYDESEEELVAVVRDAEQEQERMVLQGDVDCEDDDDDGTDAGTVKSAFSRKRGFTKKRKKLRREA